MKKHSMLFSFVLMVSILLSGCCSNYGTYANSMALDLDALNTTYRGYVENDTRLSDADRAARLSVIDEMLKKTKVAQDDTQ